MVNYFKRRDNGDFIALLLTALAGVMIFSLSNRLIGGQYSLCVSDFQAQYIPYVRLFLHKLFSGENITYSFANGLGDDVIASFNCFSCISPFSLVFLLIANDYVAGAVLVILKFAVAAFFFYRFCSIVLERQGMYVSVISVAYALGGFSVVSYININMMDALYILPILIICLKAFLLSDKRCGLALCYAYTFITCFYTGYVIGLLSAFIFVLALSLLSYNEDKRFDYGYFIRKLKEYIGLVIVSVLLSCVVILPTAYYVICNRASDATEYMGMQATFLDLVGSLYVGAIRESTGMYPFYYSGLMILFGIPAFYMSSWGKYSKKLKLFVSIVFAFIVLCTLNSTLYMLMHCMDAPDGIGYRFGYIFGFIACGVCVFVFDKIDFSKHKIGLMALIIVFAYMVVWYIASAGYAKKIMGYNLNNAVLNLALVLIYVLLLWLFKCGQSRFIKGTLLFVMFIEVVLNGVLMNTNMSRPMISSNELISFVRDDQQEVLRLLPDDADKYRLYIKNATPNMTHLYNIHGIGNGFSTFENCAVREMFLQTGYASSTRVLTDYGSTPLVRMLLAQKYNIVTNGISCDTDVAEPYIEENEYTLSVGYMVSDAVLDVKWTADKVDINPFENQNSLISAMIGDDTCVYKRVDALVNYSADGLSLYNNDNQSIIYILNEGSDGGILSINIDVGNAQDVYVYFPQLLSGNYNNVPLLMTEGADEGCLMYLPQITLPHIMPIKLDDNGTGIVISIVNRGMEVEGGQINDLLVYELDNDKLAEVYDELSSQQLRVDRFEDGLIEGEITVNEEDELLLFSVPYSAAWSLYVDGRVCELVPAVSDTLMAAYINPGEHHIKLVYNNRWCVIGGALSVLGLIILAFMIKKDRKKHA